MHDHLTYLIYHYGAWGLFFLLALGIIGLPIPDETLLLLSGFLAAKGKISLIAIFFAGFFGGSLGITVSYLLGRFVGHSAIVHFGKYIGLTEQKIKEAHQWSEKFGKYILLVGYFIPGLRHLTGIIAGTTELDYPLFAIFAYTGAIIWSTTFICIGYFFFHEWQQWNF